VSKNDKQKREQEQKAAEAKAKPVVEKMDQLQQEALAAQLPMPIVDGGLVIGPLHAPGAPLKESIAMGATVEVAKLRAEVEQALQMAQEAEQRCAKRANEVMELRGNLELLIEERDRLKVRVSTLESAASAPARSTEGWSSPRAKELVEEVAPHERDLLLGDLLADLARLAGETGKKESAQDVLKRLVQERADLALDKGVMLGAQEVAMKAMAEMEAKLATLQAAMVTKRAPDASAGAVLDRLGGLLDNYRRLRGGEKREDFDMLAMQKEMVEEWWALRSLLNPNKPMTAVAVVDDSTPALAERYSLMVLKWDGKALDFELIDGPARPWMDLDRPMRHAVDTRLRPSTFR
jgi:hypothetical protein